MIVCDTEVFNYDWVFVAYDLIAKRETIIVNNEEEFKDFYDKHHKDLWIGYNIAQYDIYIIKAILCGFNPKDVNDFIIVRGQNGYRYSKMFNRIPLNIFDIMPNPPVGLKTLEGFMGADIRETTVPFDIERKLTAGELAEVIKYCSHDVQQTVEVLSRRMEELTSQLDVVKMFDMPKSAMGKSKAQLSAMALGAERREHNDELDFSIPNTLKIKKYQFVVDWFVDCRNRAINNVENGIDEHAILHGFYSQKLKCDVGGVPHIFAWGGLHGAINNYRAKGYFVNIDVASYYPSLMIEYDYISRNIRDKEHYKEVYRKRLEYKAAGDKRANPLKIVLNSTYGALKDRFNPLYDPMNANNVCVAGQLLLLDLIEHLEPFFDIIQSNTDGILVKLRAETEDQADKEYSRLDCICQEWETRTRMNLEFEEFSEVVQKDVNNYVVIPRGELYDEKGKPRWKAKGAYVKKLSPLDYDLPIVNKALMNYFLYGLPVEKTIGDCNDLIEFQKIVKISKLYKFATHNGERLTEKTFRVFASKRDSDTKICKCKREGATEEKFANTPEKCFIDNSEVKGRGIPDYLDKQWYINLANSRLRDFLGER